MKRVIFAVAAAATLTAGTIGAANALEFGLGPGGVHVGPGWHHRHYYDYDGGCRTVITHRGGFTVRRHICD